MENEKKVLNNVFQNRDSRLGQGSLVYVIWPNLWTKFKLKDALDGDTYTCNLGPHKLYHVNYQI